MIKRVPALAVRWLSCWRATFIAVVVLLLAVLNPAARATGEQQLNIADVLDAAEQALGAVVAEDCDSGSLDQTPCITLLTPIPSLERGVAAFLLVEPDGVEREAYFARDAAESWQLWYIADGPTRHQPNLPGIMLACAGGPLSVYARPGEDAEALETVEEHYAVTVDRFLLVQKGEPGGAAGEGWYRLTVPVQGWARGSELINPLAGNCR